MNEKVSIVNFIITVNKLSIACIFLFPKKSFKETNCIIATSVTISFYEVFSSSVCVYDLLYL